MARAAPKPPPADLIADVFKAGSTRMALVQFRCEGRPTLTRAEHRVVVDILRGHSNAEIARAHGVSVRTVASQVASALRKLRVGSRAELAVRLAELLAPGVR
jgi:DNA-binding CsgD family transcriptional regulator